MDKMEVFLLSILALIVLSLAFLLVYLSFCNTKNQSLGVVIEKHYAAGQTSVGVAPVVGGNGGVAVVSTSTTASFNVVVETERWGRVMAEFDCDAFLNTDIGQTVAVAERRGLISGIKYGYLVAR